MIGSLNCLTKKLSKNKLSVNNLAVDYWKIGFFFKPITIEEIVVFMINKQ